LISCLEAIHSLANQLDGWTLHQAARSAEHAKTEAAVTYDYFLLQLHIRLSTSTSQEYSHTLHTAVILSKTNTLKFTN